MEEVLHFKVVNNLTGEIIEREVENAEQAKDFYLELSASENATKKAKTKLALYLDEFLGQDDSYDFKDGKRLRRVQRESRTWTVEGLRRVGLDEDAVDTLLKVDMTMAKAIVAEMVERGDIVPNAGKVLNESAEVKATKPFVEIR